MSGWNGNEWGTKKTTDSAQPDMRARSNRCKYLMPKLEESNEVAELKSYLYQWIFSKLLSPIEQMHHATVGRKSSDVVPFSVKDSLIEKLKLKLSTLRYFENSPSEHSEHLQSIVKAVKLLVAEAKKITASGSGSEFDNSSDQFLGQIVDALLTANAEGVVPIFQNFFRPRSAATKTKDEVLDACKTDKSWSNVVERIHQPVAATSFCLWTALYEAMIEAGVPEMTGVLDSKKVKDLCLGFMLNPDESDKTKGFKEEIQKLFDAGRLNLKKYYDVCDVTPFCLMFIFF